MNQPAFPVRLSPLEEARFGVRTARADEFVTAAVLPQAIEFCAAHQVQFLIARCRAEDAAAAQTMEAHGFILAETTAFLARDVTAPIAPHEGAFRVRPFEAADMPAVERIAAQAFHGYFSHYHADPRLDPVLCDRVYIDWASRSCTVAGVADAVFVADADGTVVGFLTMKRNSVTEAQPVLSGVLPEGRRQGVYRMLIRHGLEWSRQAEAVKSVAAVHVANSTVLRALGRLGYQPDSAYHTFHKWFV